jgi:beta-glucanase (GH16 family)
MGVNLDENVFQENGMLKIRVKNEQVNWFGQTKEFSTGVIYSRGNWKFYKGRFEIRCKIPYASGAPLLWPAFWMHGGIPGMTNSESEIDVFEFCGHQAVRDTIVILRHPFLERRGIILHSMSSRWSGTTTTSGGTLMVS